MKLRELKSKEFRLGKVYEGTDGGDNKVLGTKGPLRPSNWVRPGFGYPKDPQTSANRHVLDVQANSVIANYTGPSIFVYCNR